MLKEFLEKANKGESVYMPELRKAFAGEEKLCCVFELTDGSERAYTIPLPKAETAEEQAFVKEYFYGNMYNLISALGGKKMRLYAKSESAYTLCQTLNDVFQINKARSVRAGYGKCLNVTDRMNAALGFAPFCFETFKGEAPLCEETPNPRENAVPVLKSAVKCALHATLLGMDIGGTDIKLIAAKEGRIIALKEYDWNPALMCSVDTLKESLLLLPKVLRAAISLPSTKEGEEIKAGLLDKGASHEKMCALLKRAEGLYGQGEFFDGIGVCFPDVVVGDMIVGGETLKTRGIREHSANYEKEFALLRTLQDELKENCREGGVVHMANDGSLAAYTAAVELAHGTTEMVESVKNGVFAHSLGTELGTGWIDEKGEIPQLPLELYNCVIDLGDVPARNYEVLDIRSTGNFNTGLFGTLQKYGSQSGAYRLFYKYAQQHAPALLKSLFDEGYLEEKNGGVYVRQSPKDMRKPLLERIMTLASEKEPQAERVFFEIGRYLAVTYLESEFILSPKCRQRVLFGRFIKKERCFSLMQEGARNILPLELVAGDASLAYTPLMKDLCDDPVYTVAQFGQAVGAAYFAASELKA